MANKEFDNVQLFAEYDSTVGSNVVNVFGNKSKENIAYSLSKIKNWFPWLVPTNGSAGQILEWYNNVPTWRANTNADTVKQTHSTDTDFHPLVLGAPHSESAWGGAISETTDQVYMNKGIYVKPSTSTIYATDYRGKINGFSLTGTSGSTYDLNSFITSQFISSITTTGNGNGVTAIGVNNGVMTVTKGSTFSLEGHSHTLSIATDTGNSQLSMSANTKYKLTAGGSTFIFTTPPDSDTKVTSSANHYTPATASGQDKTASASGATAAWSIDVVKGVTLNTDGKGHVTGISVTSGKIPANPVPSNNVTGSGTSGYLTKWNGTNTITNGPQLGSSTTTFLRNDGTWATPPVGEHTHAYTVPVGITVKTGSSDQSHITLQTLMNWLITTKGYITSNTARSLSLYTSWSYAGNDILQLTIDGTAYELQLAGVIIEFDGYASDYQTGTFRLRIHSSPTISFTPASGYTQFPASHIAEYTCNGSSYSPTWKMIATTVDLSSYIPTSMLTVTKNTNVGITPSSNVFGYVSGLTAAAWNFQQTDGTLFSQYYNDKWQTEIYMDYRTGQMSTRGKNNGTWQDWRIHLDSGNYSSYALPLSGGTMTGDISFTPISPSSYPAASKGIKWSGGTDAIDMYYNLRESDAGELIINMRDDANVRTSFAYNGTVKSYIDTDGTYNGNATTSSRAYSLYTGDVTVSTTSHATALQTFFEANKSTIVRNRGLGYYSNVSSNGSFYFGYFLSGYDSNPYGGFFVCHYNNPYYVGIQNGTFVQHNLLTNQNYASHITQLGTVSKGSTIKGIYLDAGVPKEMTYSLNSTVNSGTANCIAYYSGANAISSAAKVTYVNANNSASTPATVAGLHIESPTYGNTAANMLGGVAGVFSYGDGGPQIVFSGGDTLDVSGGQNSALIWTADDAGDPSAPTGVSWHFVSDQPDWNVTSKRFHARTAVTIGTDKPVANSYNLYVTGNGYFSTGITSAGFSTTGTNKGYRAYDQAGAQYAIVYDNGSNLWVGAEASNVYHHKGQTYISSGWTGTLPTTANQTLTGNPTIFISVPKYTTNAQSVGSWNHTPYSVLHSGNYTDYTVTKTGTGCSGTWSINVTGNAATLKGEYPSVVPITTLAEGQLKMFYHINSDLTGNMPATNNAVAIIQLNRHSGNYDSQLGFSNNGNIYYRRADGSALTNSTAWNQIAFTSSKVAKSDVLYSYNPDDSSTPPGTSLYETYTLAYYQTAKDYFWTGGAINNGDNHWAHYITMKHTDNYHCIMRFPFWHPPQYIRKESGSVLGWYNFVTDEDFSAFRGWRERCYAWTNTGWYRVMEIPAQGVSTSGRLISDITLHIKRQFNNQGPESIGIRILFNYEDGTSTGGGDPKIEFLYSHKLNSCITQVRLSKSSDGTKIYVELYYYSSSKKNAVSIRYEVLRPIPMSADPNYFPKSWLPAGNNYTETVMIPISDSPIGILALNIPDHTSQMNCRNANGYYGLANPVGNDYEWLRSSSLGLIPYESGAASSGGHSNLGTSSWYFKEAYVGKVIANTIDCEGLAPRHTNEINFKSPGSTLWFGYRIITDDKGSGTTSPTTPISTYLFGCGKGGGQYASIRSATAQLQTSGASYYAELTGGSLTYTRTIHAPDANGTMSVSKLVFTSTGATTGLIDVPTGARYLVIEVFIAATSVKSFHKVAIDTSCTSTSLIQTTTNGQYGLQLTIQPIQFTLTNATSITGGTRYTLTMNVGSVMSISAGTTPSAASASPQITKVYAQA